MAVGEGAPGGGPADVLKSDDPLVIGPLLEAGEGTGPEPMGPRTPRRLTTTLGDERNRVSGEWIASPNPHRSPNENFARLWTKKYQIMTLTFSLAKFCVLKFRVGVEGWAIQ